MDGWTDRTFMATVSPSLSGTVSFCTRAFQIAYQKHNAYGFSRVRTNSFSMFSGSHTAATIQVSNSDPTKKNRILIILS